MTYRRMRTFARWQGRHSQGKDDTHTGWALREHYDPRRHGLGYVTARQLRLAKGALGSRRTPDSQPRRPPIGAGRRWRT